MQANILILSDRLTKTLRCKRPNYNERVLLVGRPLLPVRSVAEQLRLLVIA
jgi:hypothetical protein